MRERSGRRQAREQQPEVCSATKAAITITTISAAQLAGYDRRVCADRPTAGSGKGER